MPRGEHKYSNLWTAAIFIILEVAAVAMLRSSSVLQNIWINKFSHAIIAKVWGGTQKVSAFINLKDANETLLEENASLSAQLLSLKVRSDSTVFSDSTFTYTVAHIVKVSTNTLHNYIILDKGLKDGIEPDCGIITSRGVIGTIGAVSEKYSYGITLMNPNLSVSARIGANGLVTPLMWDGKHTDGAILNDMPIKYEVNPGDTVWTSGFSTLYPGGIPLGTIESLRTLNGATNRANVSLFEDFATLNCVLIVKNNDAAEIRYLEKKEEAQK